MNSNTTPLVGRIEFGAPTPKELYIHSANTGIQRTQFVPEHKRQLDELLGILAKLFDWSDTSLLHAFLHIENAVRNLQADVKVERAYAAHFRAFVESVAEHECEYPDGCDPSRTDYRCDPCRAREALTFDAIAAGMSRRS